jgi:tRNA threonylcarbamoyladenosine biosynthesis protein TsaB
MQLQLTILAFDTTGTQDSLSLYHKGIMTSKVLPTGGSQLQSSILIPSLQSLLKEQKLTFQDIHVLATVSGPGSFTGIRIGLATAQGLLIAGKYRPVFPTLLEILAFAARQKNPSAKILSLIDSKRGDYFCQPFDSNLIPVQTATTISEADIHQLAEPFVIVSTHPIPSIPDVIVPTQSVAELLIEFCLEIALKDDTGRYQTMAPFYIRHPEFKKQKRFLS